MSDYVLEGEKWGSPVFGTAGGNITWAVDGSVPAALVAQISAAFADWAGYANITFTKVSSTVAAKIDFSSTYIDGADSVLGETSYSYSGASFQSADVTFDSSEGWHTSGSQVFSNDGVNFFVVALHEIGHALGMDHYNSGLAVMNAYINPAVTNLTQSDIDGIQAIYGTKQGVTAVGNSASFGAFVHDATSAGGEVFALYKAFLGRSPDPLGFEEFTHDLQSGMSVHDLAQTILSSAEHTQNFGAYDQLSDAAFVTQLYRVVQGRTPDAPGLAHWEQALASGVSRVDIGVSFALSAEHIGDLQASYTAGVFDPDKGASDIARLYYGIQGRAPDGGGLSHFLTALANGESVQDVAKDFLGSAEYQSKFGGLSDAQFVDTLYQNALGRHAETDGLGHFVSALQHGASRAEVTYDIAESQEAHQHLMPAIEQGWVLA